VHFTSFMIYAPHGLRFNAKHGIYWQNSRFPTTMAIV
jgi:hypothetical protein